jgi:hypothetical protein
MATNAALFFPPDPGTHLFALPIESGSARPGPAFTPAPWPMHSATITPAFRDSPSQVQENVEILSVYPIPE